MITTYGRTTEARSAKVSSAARPTAPPSAHTRSGRTPPDRWLWRLALRAVRAAPVAADADLDELMAAMAWFADRGARGAFVQTTRSALSWSGQRLDGTERLYLLAEVPVLLVGGRRDTVIPVEHTVQAHAKLPGSRLEIFAAGHFPHVEHPQRLTRRLLDFLATTTPARADQYLRRQLRRTPGAGLSNRPYAAAALMLSETSMQTLRHSRWRSTVDNSAPREQATPP
jgi:pimeloyl-ACP methyl ester carboxylesterase